jgi:hypothetical protein
MLSVHGLMATFALVKYVMVEGLQKYGHFKYASHKKTIEISAQGQTKALLKQSAEVGDGDYGEAVQGSTVADESPASSELNKAEPWFI